MKRGREFARREVLAHAWNPRRRVKRRYLSGALTPKADPPNATRWTWGPIIVGLPCDMVLRFGAPTPEPGRSFMPVTYQGEPAWWGWFNADECTPGEPDRLAGVKLIIMPRQETP